MSRGQKPIGGTELNINAPYFPPRQSQELDLFAAPVTNASQLPLISSRLHKQLICSPQLICMVFWRFTPTDLSENHNIYWFGTRGAYRFPVLPKYRLLVATVYRTEIRSGFRYFFFFIKVRHNILKLVPKPSELRCQFRSENQVTFENLKCGCI